MKSLDERGRRQNLVGMEEEDEDFPDDVADDPDLVRELLKIL